MHLPERIVNLRQHTCTLSVIKTEYLGMRHLALSIVVLFTSVLSAQSQVDLGASSTYADANWQPVLNAVKDKRIILLGEFTHGAKEIFSTRNDLIRTLHVEEGFDVIVFESGIGELAAVDAMRDHLDSVQLTRGFFGGWRTPEFQELMKYARDEGIAVAGFDVQRTGGISKFFLMEFAEEVGMTPAEFEKAEDAFNAVDRRLKDRDAVYDSVKVETALLIDEYGKLHEQLQSIQQTDSRALLVLKTLENRMAYLNYRLDFVRNGDWTVRWNARDSMMAANVDWLLQTIYPGKRVIIIGHNFHIARHNDRLEVMGELLLPKYGDQMYSVGVFAGGGTYLDNSGNPREMMAPDTTATDIKTVIRALSGPLHFIDMHSDVSSPSMDRIGDHRE